MKVCCELRNTKAEISFAVRSYSTRNGKKKNERMRDVDLRQKKWGEGKIKILNL